MPLRPVAEPRRRFPWQAGVALLLLGLGALAAYELFLKPEQRPQTAAPGAVRIARVVRGSVIRSLRIGGQTSARNFALLSVPVFRGPDSSANLTVMKLAKPGVMVKKGEVVAEMDPQNARDHIDDMNDTVAQAEADIRKRQAEQQVDRGNLDQTLRIAKADLDKARLEYGAAEVRTDIERELMKLNLDEAEMRYRELQNDVASAQESDRAEIRILEITRDQQKIHRDRHLADIQKFVMRAPMAGLVVMQQVNRGGELGQIQEGDPATPGQPLLKVVDPHSMQVEGKVNQAESSLLRLGQPAVVGLDAFPDLRFSGRVFSIGALAVRGWRENYYVRSVPVRVAIEGQDQRLIPDLSAWADVELERRDNVPVVPREAIRIEGDRKFVYLRTGSAFRRRPVEVGLEDAVQAAVVSGLVPGDEVALEAPQAQP